MILLRVSILFLLYGIICCQESVNIAPTGETKLSPAPDRLQELVKAESKPEDKEDKSAQFEDTQGGIPVPTPSPTSDFQRFIVRRRRCCDDGRQHFYMNGNCDNRPREANEAVGLWCDRKFLECCTFMEAYYGGPVEGCRHKNKNCSSRLPSPTDSVPIPEINRKVTPADDKPQEPAEPTSKPKNKEEKSAQSEVTQGGIREPQPTPDPMSDLQQFVARRRRCCDDGRQHFYTNGNCDNRPREANEAVGLWCDRKFLECCNFMEAYYAGPVEGCHHKNKNCSSQLPSPTHSVPNSEINGKVTPVDDKPEEPTELESKAEDKEAKSIQLKDTQGGHL